MYYQSHYSAVPLQCFGCSPTNHPTQPRFGCYSPTTYFATNSSFMECQECAKTQHKSETTKEVGANEQPAIPDQDESPTKISPRPNDVLMGRGGKNNKHIGNEKLRNLARARAEEYTRLRKKGKSMMSRDLVKAVRQRKGRFLKRNPKTDEWEDMGDDAAREKTAQVLRDAVCELGMASSTATPAAHDTNEDDATTPKTSNSVIPNPRPTKKRRTTASGRESDFSPMPPLPASSSIPPPPPILSRRQSSLMGPLNMNFVGGLEDSLLNADDFDLLCDDVVAFDSGVNDYGEDEFQTEFF